MTSSWSVFDWLGYEVWLRRCNGNRIKIQRDINNRAMANRWQVGTALMLHCVVLDS